MNQYCLFAVSLATLLWSRVAAIPVQNNVDTEEPTVIKSPNSADPNDGFGWTALLHQIEVVNDNDDMAQVLSKTRVIVGAPRGTFPGGLTLEDYGLPAINRSGLIYSCPLGPGICEGVTGDRTLYDDNVDSNITNGVQLNVNEFDFFFSAPISEGRLFDQAPDSLGSAFDSPDNVVRVERKSDQLLGSFIYSNGDRLIACAPKWVFTNLGINVQPRGLCFSGHRNLTGFRAEQPCITSGNSDSDARANGFCVTNSATILNNRIAIGAAGFDFFIGRVFTRSFDVPVTTAYQTASLPGLVRSTSNQLLFGYQVVTGSVTGPDANMVISAPRFNGTYYLGAVFVFDNQDPPMNLNIMLEGRQVAEFFGYSLALCDLTGDGFDELLVGAPMYTNLDPLCVEQGRLYVFFNTGGNFDPDPVILLGSGANVRFGFTVTNAGDLDADGHEDMIVSAPYEESTDKTDNTGAIYVYYGRDTREAFEKQSPQRIHADDIVSNVNNLSPLRTFGFSLSGDIDVDGNMHKDFVAGSLLDQTVVVLRTRPIINISVSLDPVDAVIIDIKPSFNVTVRATYTSVLLTSSLAISFTLREDLPENGAPRLFFANGVPSDIQGEGMFDFTGDGVEAVATVVVYTVRDVSEVDPYQLILDIKDVPRNLAPVDGNQQVSDLSGFPRIRVEGNANLTVVINDTCGTDGCTSDVVMNSPTPSTRVLTAGSQSALIFDIDYNNTGLEEARGLALRFSGLRLNYFTSVSLAPRDSSSTFDCTAISESGEASCQLQNRLRADEMRSALLTFSVNTTTIIGNETNFTVTLNIVVDTANQNMDSNLDNNMQDIFFSVNSVSNIGVTLLSRKDLMYSAMASDSVSIPGDLGSSYDLTIRVTNTGPSTILNSRVEISFPAQNSQITGSNYFLYPSILSGTPSEGTSVNCTDAGLDPMDLVRDGVVVVIGRRRRSLPVSHKARIAKRIALEERRATQSENRRHKRQTESDVTHSCLDSPCLRLTCDITRLTTQGVTLVLSTNIDERFFGVEAADRTFLLTTNASVVITEPFQVSGDNPADNFDVVSIMLSPTPTDTGNSLIIHYIIWPCVVASLVIMAIIVVLLYFVGFFRRKKKPGEDEIEGDFTAPTVMEVKEVEVTGL